MSIKQASLPLFVQKLNKQHQNKKLSTANLQLTKFKLQFNYPKLNLLGHHKSLK